MQKILAPVVSRRKAEEMIAAGRVTVNGVVAVLGTKANPTGDDIRLDGKPIEAKADVVYIMLHKPEGVVTTANDPQGRPTVMDLLPKGSRCFSVGRLDYDSSGLLLMTNDGDLAFRLTHPGHQVKKLYIARVRGLPDEKALAAFRGGLMIDGNLTAPCEIEVTKKEPNAQLRITLHEGRNRQVRKMCDAIGFPVLSLKRVAIGKLQLGDLKRGQWRHLTGDEVKML